MILDCIIAGTVSATSAMVFMKDSERAAALGRENTVDIGLHLNLTTGFDAAGVPSPLRERQRRIAQYLRRHRLAQVVFNPRLTHCFQYVVAAQFDEFSRLYGRRPSRIDGHHHMHLCANVLLQKLLPPDTLVRRNFTFQPGEKGLFNRAYRSTIDTILSRRHRLVDFLFALPPIEPAGPRGRIFSLSDYSLVEVETHPVNEAEYQLLSGGLIHALLGGRSIARRFDVCRRTG
jgi:hypothetical protein